MDSLLHQLESIDGDLVNVGIDTPSGSASKFKYDEKSGCNESAGATSERPSA